MNGFHDVYWFVGAYAGVFLICTGAALYGLHKIERLFKNEKDKGERNGK